MKKDTAILLLFIVLLGKAETRAQDELARQYEYACLLMQKGNYYDAVTEFKRLLFFDMRNKYKFVANSRLGECYKQGAKYADAVFYLNVALQNSPGNKERLIMKKEIIKVNILRRSFDNALQQIYELEKDTTSGFAEEADYWRGWTYIFEDDWEKAAECFSKKQDWQELKKICVETDKHKYSVTMAKLLSVFLPGSGQFYTGNYMSGIMSVGWNFLWGYISVNSLIENRVFDGLMTANFLLLRFYLGNVQNAEKFAENRNLEITNKALNYLQNNFNGEKP